VAIGGGYTEFAGFLVVGDGPGGPLKQLGKPHLKPAKKTKVKHVSLKHAGHGPRHGGPDGPPRRPTQKSLRAGSASLEGAPHAHARSLTRVWAFNVLTAAGGAIMRLGLAPRSRRTNSLGGNPSPPLWGTVRRGWYQSRDTAPPTPVRLTRRALEGGPAAPSICFPVTLQG
jgi:hypothetical protein